MKLCLIALKSPHAARLEMQAFGGPGLAAYMVRNFKFDGSLTLTCGSCKAR